MANSALEPELVLGSATDRLCAYAAQLDYSMLPQNVVDATKTLFLDWVGSALGGANARQTASLLRFSRAMGPATGNSEILPSRERSSPLFAALVNAAASHVVEQDDLHNASVVHPATVVFPALLAIAQAYGLSGQKFIAAAVVGYEVATRVGAFLGVSHYKVFHTTGTAGTLGAAAAVAHALALDKVRLRHALGSAATQAAGLWEFLSTAADSKQLHTAKAAANGLLAAYLAADDFTGAHDFLSGAQGLAAGMSQAADERHLLEGLGQHSAVLETSLKWHASCRHTHPCADALKQVLDTQAIALADVETVQAYVYQAAADVLGTVQQPQTVHQSKFSMGFVLALIAIHGDAGAQRFNAAALKDPALLDFAAKVRMHVDPTLDVVYPRQWAGRVELRLYDGRRFTAKVDCPKGDPAYPLSAAEVTAKVAALAAYSGAATPEDVQSVCELVQNLEQLERLPTLLSR